MADAFDIDPDQVEQAGRTVGNLGDSVHGSSGRLRQSHTALGTHLRGSGSHLGTIIADGAEKAVQIADDVMGQLKRVLSRAGLHMGEHARTSRHIDDEGSRSLRQGGEDGEQRLPGTGRTGENGTRSPGQTAEDGRGTDAKELSPDPVDLVTGEVLLTQTDLHLPGVLPLTLTRTHLSNYRGGGSFGTTWACTLDQRLEFGDTTMTFHAEDGARLVYRRAGGASALPEYGARWPLRRTATGYAITQQPTGRELHFGADGLLSRITDRAGHWVEFDRDAGVPTAVRHSAGYRVEVSTADGLVTALSVAGVRVARFGYHERRLTEVYGAGDLPQLLVYDPAGRLTGWVDRNNTWYRYHYDDLGRCVRAEGADGQLTGQFHYDAARRSTTVTDSLGGTTVLRHNELRQVVSVTDQLGGETRSEHDRHNQLVSRTDPLGRTVRIDHDAAGNPVRRTHPDGSTESTEYDGTGQPVAVTGPDGAVWRQDLDAVGNPVSSTDAAGGVTRFGYDDAHHLASVTTPGGAVTLVECDPAGLPVAVVDPRGARTEYRRDAFGRVVQVTDPDGGRTRVSWTTQGWLASVVGPDGGTQRWRYDGEGNLVEHVDPIGGVTSTEYAGFDLPVARTDPTGARTRFDYDTELRLVSVTNPNGLVWRYDHDALGNLVTETDFNGRTVHYAHDLAGRLLAVTNASGQRTTFDYDQLGRLLRRDSPDGTDEFGYDAAGRLVRATGPHADVLLERDVLGQVTAEVVNGRRLATDYDADGRPVRLTTPTGARSHWEYDPAGLPVALHTAGRTIAFSHDGLGREVARRFGAVTMAQTWHPGHRLAAQVLTAGPPQAGTQTLVQQRSYQYRADGAVTAVHDQLAGSRHFDLDPLGRATTVTGPAHREQYQYDWSDNIASADWPGAAAGPRSGAGTLVRSAGRTRHEHDPDGRVVARHLRTLSGQTRTWRYSWSSADRLTSVTTPDGSTWRYEYDPFGRRTAKVSAHERIEFTWDGSRLAEQVHSGGQSLNWSYEPGGHAPLTQVQRALTAPQEWVDQEFYAVVSDLVGTPTELVDAQGVIAWRPVRSLWGADLASSRQRADCPLRFPGQYFDPETGHNYNFHRYYDPPTATYLSADPLGLRGGPNPNAYVPNPLDWLDPLGLVPGNCRGRKLSDPNPVPSRIRNEYENVRAGQGTPRIDPQTGQQTRFTGRQLGQQQRQAWQDSREWDVPGTTHRILERPDGKLGYVLDHDYSAPFLFPAPWYAEGGAIPKRLGG